MNRLLLVVFCAAVLATPVQLAAAAVYHYEPEQVELSGTLIEKSFYGPPGYGEDPEHDSKEPAYVILLPEPATVVPAAGDATNERHDEVSEVQVVNGKQLPLRPLLNKKVTLRGTLFSAITGHHHTDVLINLEEIKAPSAGGPTHPQSPEQVIKSLYGAYPPEGKEAIEWQKKEVLVRYFDGHLTDLFIKDQECQVREKGICNLDFMVLYDAQDEEITGFRVGDFDPAKKTVPVQFKNFGKPVTLTYRMSQTADGGWRISDIQYQKGKSLVEILSQ